MQHQISQLPGPVFLEKVAEAELHNGNLINAQEYHRRAIQWAEDQKALEAKQREVDAARDELAAVKERLNRLQIAVAECAA